MKNNNAKKRMLALLGLLLAAIMAGSVFAGCSSATSDSVTNGDAATTSAQEDATDDGQDNAAESSDTDGSAADTASTSGQTREFTDSAGRTVEVPENITKVAVSGSLAQIVLFAICPDELVGISSSWDASAEEFLDTKYYDLPVLGQMYGGSGDLNLETLLNTGAEIIIDVGETKTDIAAEMDELQQQVGIPVVHIACYTESMDQTYRMLGDLLGKADEGEALASYCEGVYQRTVDIANSVEKVNLLYVNGDEGLNVIAEGSYHAEVIDLLSNNLAKVDNPSSKGLGNEVDMEQILSWNPDVVLFAPGSIYDTVTEDKNWSTVTAIKNGTYYEVPQGPYNWMGFPPSVQRLLGMMWMAKLLYPEQADYNLYDEVSKYFELFYHCDITQEQYDRLVENSIGKVENS